MRKTNAKVEDELRPHYDFDYTKARPNRFAERLHGDVITVILDPDVAAVFKSSAAVNGFLRAAMSAMPPRPKKKRAS